MTKEKEEIKNVISDVHVVEMPVIENGVMTSIQLIRLIVNNKIGIDIRPVSIVNLEEDKK